MKELALEVAKIEEVTEEVQSFGADEGGAGIDFLIEQIDSYTDY